MLANVLTNGRFMPVAGTGHLIQEDVPEVMITTIYRDHRLELTVVT